MQLANSDMPGATLTEITRALGSALVGSPTASDAKVRTVAILDATNMQSTNAADLLLMVGVTADGLGALLRQLNNTEQRPVALLVKIPDVPAATVDLAQELGIAVIEMHAEARWDIVYSLARRIVEREAERAVHTDLADADTDLFGLAQTTARLTHGMVTIEDDHAHVLAYSASGPDADELRTLSILGRAGPAEYMRRLAEWGVLDALRSSDGVVDVEPHVELGIKRRLAINISAVRDDGLRGRSLGTMWVQQRDRPFADDAPTVLVGAAAVAARILIRAVSAPSNEMMQIQRLFGALGGGVDVPSLAGALNIPEEGPSAVVGFAAEDLDPSLISSSLRLRASAFRRDALTTSIGSRVYVLFPKFTSVNAVTSWAAEVVTALRESGTLGLHAAVAAPIDDVAAAAPARTEVDRVLDAAALGPDGVPARVATLADSRTRVLLREILDLVAARPELKDPRLDALFEYDARRDTDLVLTATTYLRWFGDVKSAAQELHIHPNTLRYRVKRAEEILGVDMSDPQSRLLTEIQLAIARR